MTKTPTEAVIALVKAAKATAEAYDWWVEAYDLPSPPATAEMLRGADKGLKSAMNALHKARKAAAKAAVKAELDQQGQDQGASGADEAHLVASLPRPETRSPTGREIWDAPEPPTEMVWAVCPYLRNCDDCKHCPAWQDDPHIGELVQRGCYTLAAEACRVVFAMQARVPSTEAQEGRGS